MKVVIVSTGNRDCFLKNQKLVNFISSDFELLSFDNQDKNLGVMVVEEKNQVMADYDEQSSDSFFKTNTKKKIKQQNREINRKLRQNKR